MAKKPVLTDINNISSAGPTINENSRAIEDAFENTLSRDGSSPNQMEADLDLNGNDLLNVGILQAQDLSVGGDDLSGVLASVIANAEAAAASSEEAAKSAAEAALYDGPNVDTHAELAGLTAELVSVGDYVQVLETGAIVQRVESDGDLDYTGAGGLLFLVNESEEGFVVTHFGAVGTGFADDSVAFQAAADACKRTGDKGTVVVPSGAYLLSNTVEYGSFTIFKAEGEVMYIADDNLNGPMFQSAGAVKWADGIASTTAPVSNVRSFNWHSSITAASTQSYGLGHIVVTNPVNPKDAGWENGEVWYEATSVGASGFADNPAHWTQCDSLLGAIFSGFQGGEFVGNYEGQVGEYVGVDHYGCAATFEDMVVHDFGDWGLKYEVPGGIYSPQVGFSLQPIINNNRLFHCGTASTGVFYNNGQSDAALLGNFVYDPRESGFGIYIGAKAGGGRWYGGHVYGTPPLPNGLTDTNWGWWSDAQAWDIDGHFEGRVYLNGKRHRLTAKIYKATSADYTETAAVYLNNPAHCTIDVRTYLFKSCIRVVGTDGGYNFLQGSLDSAGHSGTGVIDTSSVALDSTTTVLATNSQNAGDNYTRVPTPLRLGRQTGKAAVGDLNDTGTGLNFTSQGVQILRGNVEQTLWTGNEVVSRVPNRLVSKTVAQLNALTVSAGAIAYASNGRKTGETASAGTGVVAYYSAGQWRRLYDDAVVIA